MKALLVRTNDQMEEIEVGSKDPFQCGIAADIPYGYVELVKTSHRYIQYLVHENGHYIDLKPNRIASGFYPVADYHIVGDVIFVRVAVNGPDIEVQSLTDEDLKWIREKVMIRHFG
jgi:hypothetical protein